MVIVLQGRMMMVISRHLQTGDQFASGVGLHIQDHAGTGCRDDGWLRAGPDS